MGGKEDDEGAFDHEQPTPTELLPEERSRPPTQQELDHAALVEHGLRLTALERQMVALHAELEHSGLDRAVRQLRLLRRHLASWVRETVGGEEDLQKQLRRFRKYLAVWLSEE